jgi:hypothetical protein
MSFLTEAGWPIWPVLVFGASALALAISHALKPAPEKLPLIVGFGIATLIVGCLGTVVGIQRSIAGLSEVAPAQRWIVALGVRESLQDLVAALLFAAASTLATTVGSYRRARGRLRQGHALHAGT